MEPRKRIESIQERRLARQLDDLAEQIKALPADRAQALEEILTKDTTRERQARYMQRQRELGRIRPAWWLDPPILEEMKRRIAAQGGDKQDAVNAIFRELLGVRDDSQQ